MGTVDETSNPGVTGDPRDCTGGYQCPAIRHIHGCFRDYGNCTEPDDLVAHPPQAAWIVTGT